MRRPKRLTIGDTEFQIEYLKKIRDGVEGEINFHHRTIRVTDNEGWFETLFHELLHAAIFVSGKHRGFSVRKEEGLVIALETLLAPLFKLR